MRKGQEAVPLHNISSVYKMYKHIYPKTKITPQQFSAICSEMNDYVMDRVIKGSSFYMLNNVGTISLKKTKSNHKKPDWGALKRKLESGVDDGYIPRHLNIHTNGYYYMFCWHSAGGVFHKRLKRWRFLPTYYNKNNLSKYLKNNA